MKKFLLLLLIIISFFFVNGYIEGCDPCSGHNPGDTWSCDGCTCKCVSCSKQYCWNDGCCRDNSCSPGFKCKLEWCEGCCSPGGTCDTTCIGLWKFTQVDCTPPPCHACGCCIPNNCSGGRVSFNERESQNFVLFPLFNNEKEKNFYQLTLKTIERKSLTEISALNEKLAEKTSPSLESNILQINNFLDKLLNIFRSLLKKDLAKL